MSSSQGIISWAEESHNTVDHHDNQQPLTDYHDNQQVCIYILNITNISRKLSSELIVINSKI